MPDKLLSPEYGLSNSKLEECTANPSDVMNGKTFYSGDKTKKTGTFSFTGNAIDARVVEGYTFYSNSKSLRTGTLTDRNTVGKNECVGMNSNYPEVAFSYGRVPQCTTLLDGVWAFAIQVPYGYYDGNHYVGVTQGDVASSIGLTADKIKSGEQILGIWGNYTGVNPNMKLVNRTVSWGSGVIFSGDDTSASKACQFGLQYYANSEYNVHIEFRIYRNNSQIDVVHINREGGLMYDPRGYIAKWYEGSGTYKYDVNVTYHAGNGSLMIGGMIVGY